MTGSPTARSSPPGAATTWMTSRPRLSSSPARLDGSSADAAGASSLGSDCSTGETLPAARARVAAPSSDVFERRGVVEEGRRLGGANPIAEREQPVGQRLRILLDRVARALRMTALLDLVEKDVDVVLEALECELSPLERPQSLGGRRRRRGARGSGELARE